jgi:hypothetical protein
LLALHVAVPVRSCVLWSVYVPVDCICVVAPNCTVTGVTVIDTRVAAVTVSVVDPLTVPDVAVMVAEPCIFDVASPDPLIVATPAVADDQVTELVRSLLLPSEYPPVALNCSVSPAATDGVPGVTLIEVSVFGGGVVDPPPPEHPVSAEIRRPETRNKEKEQE